MSRHTPDPDLVAHALELVRMGCSIADVQETLGVPRSTVSRWVRAAKASISPERGDEIAAAVATLGDDWTIAGAADLAGVASASRNHSGHHPAIG
ncbi:MAG TPA: helix-turn-helix domain-containing protein [Polyangiaceae bacterium]|nr:helix-turn-helix domain-containing protein [Polyangiaceae bacterium]